MISTHFPSPPQNPTKGRKRAVQPPLTHDHGITTTQRTNDRIPCVDTLSARMMPRACDRRLTRNTPPKKTKIVRRYFVIENYFSFSMSRIDPRYRMEWEEEEKKNADWGEKKKKCRGRYRGKNPPPPSGYNTFFPCGLNHRVKPPNPTSTPYPTSVNNPID